MPVGIDLIGQRYGRLLVVAKAEDHICRGSGEHKRRWECVCDCGNTVYCTTGDLRCGDVKSCGCLMRETRKEKATTHGYHGTKIHNIWCAMRRRCRNVNNKDYRWYGGKGIGVCDEWESDFMSFYEWAMENGYKDGLTIDRIDPNGDYCPDNCRWVTITEQQNNRTSNRQYTYNNETHNISEWATKAGIPYSTLYMRLRNGWSFERAISKTCK